MAKRGQTMKNTQIKKEDVFIDLSGKESVSPERISNLSSFTAKKM